MRWTGGSGPGYVGPISARRRRPPMTIPRPHSSLLLLAAFATPFLGACASAGSGPSTPSPHPEAGAAEEPGALEVVEGRDFAVYRDGGTAATLEEVIGAAATADVVLMGEEHDDDVGHGVQARVFEALLDRYGERRSVVLSLEMFERDVQHVVDEYLEGLITEEHFLASARPWDNYREYYRPLVETAREEGVPVMAANAPRRYVNRVSRLGRDSLAALSERALGTLAPLPYPPASEAYRAEWEALVGEGARHMGPGVIQAQALWDATMAHSIAGALERWPDALVLHLAGAFHVEKGTGIPEALEHYRPGARQLLVAVRSAGNPSVFDPASHGGLGNFVILTRSPD